MDFSLALETIKAGRRAQRRGWNGTVMWIALQTPSGDSKMTQPYLYGKTLDGGLVPWVASQTDILADDWTVVD